jgi:hypothetical protein
VAPGQPAVLAAEGFTCRFIKAPAPYGEADLTTVDRLGQSVPVTTLECTVADLFDRPDLAGGTDELISSLDLIGRLDPDRLITRLAAGTPRRRRGGRWLERRRGSSACPRCLDGLQALAQAEPLRPGAVSGAGRLAPGGG